MFPNEHDLFSQCKDKNIMMSPSTYRPSYTKFYAIKAQNIEK